jgi:hypothetical protein
MTWIGWLTALLAALAVITLPFTLLGLMLTACVYTSR